MTEDLRELIEKHHEAIRLQLECMRRLAQIVGSIRELRGNIARAQLAKSGEPGYLPKQTLPSGSIFAVPEDENIARANALTDLATVENDLDQLADLISAQNLWDLTYCLKGIQSSVGAAARDSTLQSLNHMAFAAHELALNLLEVQHQFALSESRNRLG